MYATFNHDGSFLCFSIEEVKNKKNKFYEFEFNDINNYDYIGDFDTGKLVHIDELKDYQMKTQIFESDVNLKTKQNFEKYAPIFKQLNTLVSIIQRNSHTLNINDDEKKVLDTVIKLKDNHDSDIQNYIDNTEEFDFIKKEDESSVINKKFTNFQNQPKE